MDKNENVSEKSERESKEKKSKKTTKHKKIKISTLIVSLVLIVIGYLCAVGILIYGVNLKNYFIEQNEKIIPYPAAFIGKSSVRISDMNERLKAVRIFYQNQNFSEIGFRIDFNTPEGKNRLKIKEKDILNKLIEDEIIKQAANKRGIAISDSMINQEVENKLREYSGTEQLTDNLQRLYNWTIEDFKKNIVKPDMYKEALQKKISEEDKENINAKNKINQAKAELDNRSKFEDVVKKYSEGESVKNNGDLGWFSPDQMLPELAQIAFSLKKGESSDVINSSIGFHIIEIVDLKEENSKKMVKVRQIFVRSRGFADWLAEEEKNKDIIVLVRDYKWNADKSLVEFKDKDLINFEKNLENNSSGDISVMF
jgi:parvulin-like peptidyl-prolyl isomerase